MLRFTDLGGHRFTCFATDSKGGQLADLELRHQLRARCKDRIRAAKDTGLRNLLRHGYTRNQIWTELVAIACELRPGHRCSPLPAKPADGHPDACGCGSSPLPGAPPPGGRRLRLRIAAAGPAPL